MSYFHALNRSSESLLQNYLNQFPDKSTKAQFAEVRQILARIVILLKKWLQVIKSINGFKFKNQSLRREKEDELLLHYQNQVRSYGAMYFPLAFLLKSFVQKVTVSQETSVY